MYIEKDRQALKDLQQGQRCYINWAEDSGGLVYRIEDVFILFEISGYGVCQHYHATYPESQLEELLAVAHSWT